MPPCMGWGRYSGYFFYVYLPDGRRHENVQGPYPSFSSAAEASVVFKKTGKIFQKERPVIL